MWKTKRGKEKEEEQEEPKGDTAICGTLCICQALAVLSAVSIIYLSVIVYLPAKRELDSGIGDAPVMCTTVERRHTETYDETCRVSSCTEWCLSKGGGACHQIYVRVRQNGTDVDFEGCHDTFHKTCPVLDRTSATEHNCKKDNQCSMLEGMFLCQLGICRNISEVYSCSWKEGDEEPAQNCYYKRNCVELEGMHICRQGQCSRLVDWDCQRKCESIPIQGRNLLVIAGDRIVAAHCRRGINSRTGKEVWRGDGSSVILTTSCTGLDETSDGDMVRATDCVNGSLIPSHHFGAFTNITSLINIFHREGWQHRLDTNTRHEEPSRGTHLPFEAEITIYNRTLLFMNHEGCVNTLQEECRTFYTELGQDGRNQSFPSRFPCYYAPHNGDFVVRRFDLVQTKWTFLLFFTVPAALFVASCSMLFICSRVVAVNRQGVMSVMLSCCKEEKEETIAMKRLDNEEEENAE